MKISIQTLPTNAISSKDSGGKEVGTLAPAKNESKGNYKKVSAYNIPLSGSKLTAYFGSGGGPTLSVCCKRC